MASLVLGQKSRMKRRKKRAGKWPTVPGGPDRHPKGYRVFHTAYEFLSGRELSARGAVRCEPHLRPLRIGEIRANGWAWKLEGR